MQCGLTDGVSGFSATNSKGEWEGMDVDICRAVAAAVFGDPTKFKGTALSTQQRFTAPAVGEVDAAAHRDADADPRYLAGPVGRGGQLLTARASW